ncbi:MAG: hypothetical protein ACKVJX_03195, partial [Verrucomicrobiia bacterium]
MKRLLLTTSFLVLTGYATLADGPKDNLAENVRRIPKDGVSVPAADRSMLQEGIAVLGAKIERLRKDLEGKPELLELLPDVEIYHRAAWSALTYNEFFKANEIQTAKGLLQDGISRAGQLENGQAPWLTKKGLVVRGYRSKIDHSVQPYG